MRACSPRTRTDFKAHLLWGKGPGGLRPWERHQLGSAHPGALASSLAVDLGPSWAPAACPQPQLLRHGQPHRSHLCSRALPGGPAEGQAGLPAGCWRRGTASTGPRSRGRGAASSGSSAARLGSSGLPTAPSPAGAPWPLPAAPNHAFVAPRHSSLGHQTGLAGCAPRPGRQLSAPLTSTRSPCRQTAPRTGAALPSANLITQKIPFLPL